MKIIFGTTNERKIEDLRNIVSLLELDLEILSLNDINYNLGEIEETGKTLEENSLIKAINIYNFCQRNDIDYPILADDAGLFCNALNGEPGVYKARYADDELLLNPDLPKYQCVLKLLDKLKNCNDRRAEYRCVVTCMFPDGTFFQEYGESEGTISKKIVGELKRPYFYSVFILDGYKKTFNELNEDELINTYRYDALKKILINMQQYLGDYYSKKTSIK